MIIIKGKKKTVKGKLLALTATLSMMVATPALVGLVSKENPVFNVASAFEGGTGTVSNPYQISTVQQLEAMSKNLTAHYVLVNDINFNYQKFGVVIGESSSAPFKGTFDGRGYTISNMSLQLTKQYTGMFGYVDKTATIKNLNFDLPYMDTVASNTGILAGKVDGKIENVRMEFAKIIMEGSINYVGVLAGRHSGTYESSTGAGLVKDVTLVASEIYSYDELSKTYLGGLFGGITGEPLVESVFSEVAMEGKSYLGNIAGTIAKGTFKDIVVVGEVKGESYMGGIAGNVTGIANFENLVVAATSIGESGISTANIGGVAGAVSSASSKFNNIFILIDEIYGTNSSSVGVAIGSTPTSSSFKPTNIYSLDVLTMPIGHQKSITGNVSLDDVKLKETYTSRGMDLSAKTKWSYAFNEGIFLYSSKHYQYYSPSGWTALPVYDVDDLKIGWVTDYLEAAREYNDMDYIEQAAIEIDGIYFNREMKAKLEKELAELQISIPLNIQIEEMETLVWMLELWKDRDSLDAARAAVAQLSFNPAKQAEFRARINIIAEIVEREEYLEKTEAAIIQAEETKSEADIEAARILVVGLPEDDWYAELLAGRFDSLLESLKVDYVGEAHDAVWLAELFSTDENIAIAREKVALIPDDAITQAELTARLDEIERKIAEEKYFTKVLDAVLLAEKTKDTEDISEATILVAGLSRTVETYTYLILRWEKFLESLNEVAVDYVAEAESAVKEAEDKRTEEFIKIAEDKVSAVTDEAIKAGFTDRINAIKLSNEQKVLYQTIKNSINTIYQDISNGTLSIADFEQIKPTIEGIRDQADTLLDVAKKDELMNTIKATVELINTVTAIENGGKTKEMISKLPVSKIKDKYLIELEELNAAAEIASNLKKAQDLVTIAERNKRSTDVNNAEKAVAKVADEVIKRQLVDRLNAIVVVEEVDPKLEAAQLAVERAMDLKTKAAISYARGKVNELSTSTNKDALLKQLSEIELAVYNEGQMDRLYSQAVDAVNKAEGSSLPVYLSTAVKAVSKVADNDARKASLVERINVLQLKSKVASVETELARLELRPSQNATVKVEDSINALPDTVTQKEGFIVRLAVVKQGLDNQNYTKAKKAVEFAESAKMESKRGAYNSAIATVVILMNGDRKVDLEKRLAAVIKEVEAYERMDGDFAPGDSIVKVAESIKELDVKPYLVNWAKAVMNAEVYYGGTLSKALTKEKDAIPEHILKNEKYKDLIKELLERTEHIQESERIFGKPGQTMVKKAYAAVLSYENSRTELNYNDAVRWAEDLRRFNGSTKQVDKFIDRIKRIEIEAK